MRLTDLLPEEHIIIDLNVNERDAAIKELLTVLNKDQVISDFDQAYQAILEREKIMTTGVGNGIAIPHCKHGSCPNFAVALGVHRKGINFDSIDKKPAKIIFLLIGPENNPSLHIKLLSRISRLMSNEDLRAQLLDCKTPQEALQLLQEEEDYYFDIE